jgi:lysozyme
MTPTALRIAKRFIKDREECRLTVYPDVAGKPTIGYGHRCGPGAADISQEEAERLFEKDFALIVEDMEHYVKVPLSDNQAAALASFCFNVGVENLVHGGPGGGQSTLLRKLNAGDFTGAAAEFPRWNHTHIDGQPVVVSGLSRRREVEKALFLRGVKMVDAVTPSLEQHAAVQAEAAGRWMPDRKVIATVASNVVVFGLGWILPTFAGIPVPPEAIAAAAAAVSGLIGYTVPPSGNDLLRRAPEIVAKLKETSPIP